VPHHWSTVHVIWSPCSIQYVAIGDDLSVASTRHEPIGWRKAPLWATGQTRDPIATSLLRSRALRPASSTTRDHGVFVSAAWPTPTTDVRACGPRGSYLGDRGRIDGACRDASDGLLESPDSPRQCDGRIRPPRPRVQESSRHGARTIYEANGSDLRAPGATRVKTIHREPSRSSDAGLRQRCESCGSHFGRGSLLPLMRELRNSFPRFVGPTRTSDQSWSSVRGWIPNVERRSNNPESGPV